MVWQSTWRRRTPCRETWLTKSAGRLSGAPLPRAGAEPGHHRRGPCCGWDATCGGEAAGGWAAEGVGPPVGCERGGGAIPDRPGGDDGEGEGERRRATVAV